MGVFKAATANNLVRERLKNDSIEAVEGLRFDMLEFLYSIISFFHINIVKNQVDMTCFDKFCLFFDHASHLQFNNW